MASKIVPAVGWPGYYVSDAGDVYSRREGGGLKKLRPTADEKGYLRVSLRRRGKYHRRYVHTLVLEAFHGPRPPGCQCLHGPDRNPANCRAENLRWGTPAENVADTIADGKQFVLPRMAGEDHPGARLTWVRVNMVRVLGRAGFPMAAIAEVFQVSRKTISDVLNEKNWKSKI